VSCSGPLSAARSVPLSFFDEGDEPPTRTRSARPRPRRTSARPAPASSGGAPTDSQQIVVRRAIALGVGVLVLLLLVLGIRACANSAEKNALRDYNSEVAAIARASDTQVSQPLFQRLGNIGNASPVNVEAEINQFRAVAEDQAERARNLDVPEEMAGAQTALLLALDFRAEALASIADDIRAALGTGAGAEQAVNRTAGQMQKFLASDVLWSQRVAPLIKEGLDDAEVTGQRIEPSRFLPDLTWLDPDTVAERLGAEGGGGGSARGPAAPGLHGHGITSTSVGSTTLQPGTVNRIPASDNPTFTVAFQNQGENDESDVVVSLRISGAGSPISVRKRIDKTTAGQATETEIPLGRRPPVGTPVTITVAVAPVRGEKKTDNNRSEYPALFVR
jgi:hypothetical protein